MGRRGRWVRIVSISVDVFKVVVTCLGIYPYNSPTKQCSQGVSHFQNGSIAIEAERTVVAIGETGNFVSIECDVKISSPGKVIGGKISGSQLEFYPLIFNIPNVLNGAGKPG